MAEISGLKLVSDVSGVKLSLKNEAALKPLNEAISLYAETRGSPLQLLEEAWLLDSDLLLAQLFLGCALCSDDRMSQYQDRSQDPKLQYVLKLLEDKDRLKQYTWREQQYAKAVRVGSQRNFPEFVQVLRTIILQHPTDVTAMRMIMSLSVFYVAFDVLRDTIAGALPFWDQSHPLYVHALSFYAFGLEETNYREEAADLSYKCLSMQPKSPWATHTLSHVVEESRDPQEGVDLLVRTRADWENSGLGPHILWHLALHYTEVGAADKALEEFDTVLQHTLCDRNVYAVVDSASLLWRLELCGSSPGKERWDKVIRLVQDVKTSRGFLFLDLHIMLTLAHGKVTEEVARTALAEEFLKSVQDYTDGLPEGHMKMAYQIGAPVMEALLAFGKQRYDEVFQLILPLRHKLWMVGGSWAQRQVVVLTALKAAREGKNFKLALAMTAELKALKPKSRTLKVLYDELLAKETEASKMS